MSITPELRALTEARKRREAKRAKPVHSQMPSLVAATFKMIDKAAPFMDEGSPPNKWPPSTLLKFSYFAARSCGRDGADRDALLFILEMLDRARKLWVAGLHPNPFCADHEIIASTPDILRSDVADPPRIK